MIGSMACLVLLAFFSLDDLHLPGIKILRDSVKLLAIAFVLFFLLVIDKIHRLRLIIIFVDFLVLNLIMMGQASYTSWPLILV